MISTTTLGDLRTVERWKDRVFYTGMSLAVIASVFRGFARSYFFRSQYFSTPLAPIRESAWRRLRVVDCAAPCADRVDLPAAHASAQAFGSGGRGTGGSDGRGRRSDRSGVFAVPSRARQPPSAVLFRDSHGGHDCVSHSGRCRFALAAAAGSTGGAALLTKGIGWPVFYGWRDRISPTIM
jgi:hypothetical protein